MDTGGPVSSEQVLGKRLQQARKQAGLTQQQLCAQANLSYSTLAKIERGAIKAPSIFTVQNIAAALHTGVDALLGLESSQPAQRQESKRASSSGIQFIYFDLNDCLIRPRITAFSQLAQDSGQPIDVVESVYWRYNDAVCRGEMSLDELNTVWAERLGILVDWKKYYLAAAEIMPGITELLEWTAEHYYVGILSNTMPGFINSLQERGLIPPVRFDAVVDSSVVHALKPEPKMYETAATMASMPVDQLLLIDDSRPNLMAAEGLGWHTVWFDSYDPLESIKGIRAALET
jgi:FMN phosphatase YigB (HAD superfamily)